MVTLNNIEFQITELDGEFFYAAVKGQVHPNSLKAAVRHADFTKDCVRVYDPKNGVFSVVGEDAEFFSKLRMLKTNKERIDFLFA
jgi:hypothetical protein